MMKYLRLLALLTLPETATSFQQQISSLASIHSRCGTFNGHQITVAPTTTTTTQRSQRKISTKSYMSMHMGHSHAHNHHHHHHHHDSESKHQASPTPKSVREMILHQLSHRGILFRILFASICIFGPPLAFQRRQITRADTAMFILTSTALSFANRIRNETKYLLNKANNLRVGLVKHSPPQINASKFLFKNKNPADRVTLIGVVVNLLLSIGKAIVGVTCHSSALIADAGHSLSDLFSDFITLWAVQIARLPPDDDHPYGHGKFEAIGSLFLACMLFGTGLSVGAMSNAKLLQIISSQGNPAAASMVKMPTFPALIMAGLSIGSKEWLYRITARVGQKLNSQVVIANAWHHRSDAYSSILSLASIGLAMSVPGMVAADSAAGLLVAGMICMTGAEIMGEAVKQLTDTSDEALVERVKLLAMGQKDVLDIKRIRARWMGSSALVDVAVTTPDDLSSSAVRAVEENVKAKIMEEESMILDADVHATTTAVVCPLLNASESDRKSAHELEDDARTLLMSHSEVESVERCTLHFRDTVLAHVDASIKLKSPEETTITGATEVATELRDILESSNNINSANIFLDLNDDVGMSSMLNPVSTFTETE